MVTSIHGWVSFWHVLRMCTPEEEKSREPGTILLQSSLCRNHFRTHKSWGGADKVQKWASKMWKGPRPLLDLMKVDSAQMLVKEKSKGTAIKLSTGNFEGHVVIDLRLGRVIWKV